MDYEILDLSQKNKWKEYYNKLPASDRDIYSSPEYHEIFERRGEGKALCFLFLKQEQFAFYPFLLNSINDLGYDLDNQYFDIQGVYGYNGIVSNSHKYDFLLKFSQEFQEYAQNSNIVAEFIRFNPVLENHKLSLNIDPIELLDNVLIDLSKSLEDIWMNSYDRSVRNAIRKAEKFQLNFLSFKGNEINENYLDEYIRIYQKTMERNSARDYYYFERFFFKNVQNTLPDNTLFTFAMLNDSVVSAELLLFDGEIAYGYLGGTDAEKYYCSPNSFIRHKQIELLKSMGIKFYSIGGGSQRNDSVYIYKKSFSKKIDSRFFIGKKIYNNEIYHELISQWKRTYPGLFDRYKNYHLCYRFTK